MYIWPSATLILFVKSHIELLYIKFKVIKIINLLNNEDESYILVP